MSAIYKDGYWYPADSLNTLKAVTMSNADYEALTPQEKEELGGIEIFIPDRPLTGGGTGAVIIYNGVEYAGTPTSRLETLEEIVGDGQQSVGSDLTDAVTQLNSSLSNHEVITSGMQVPIRIAQAGNLINLTLGSAITRTWGAYETYNIGTLPVKYRPPIDVCVPCVISDRSMIFRMYIKSTGTIDIYNPGGAISSNISVISGSTITYSIV